MIKKTITYMLCILGLSMAARMGAQAQNAGDWQLVKTETYGAGGSWENGQKVRIDRSYRNGNFSYERKVSSGNALMVFTSKGKFSVPLKTYVPGETITLDVSVSASGDAGAAPAYTYGRVTIVPGAPNWSKAKLTPGTGAVDGQMTSTNGDAVASPASGQTKKLTLSGKTPSQGTEMSIVLSCNGVDVVYKYQREATGDEPVEEVVLEEALPVQEDTLAVVDTLAVEEPVLEEEPAVEETPAEEISDRDYPEPIPELEVSEFSLGKILMLLGLLILAVVDIIYMFRRPRK